MTNKNLYALVTGGTRSIGRQVAEELAEEGYNLVLIGRSAEDLETLSKDIESRFSVAVFTIESELSNAHDAFIIHSQIKEQNINIAVLANSVAGQGNFQEFLQTDLQRYLDIIQFNIVNFIVITRLFLPDMVERGSGSVISIAAGEEVEAPLRTVYRASIAFLDSFMSSVALELKGTGISVTNIRSQALAENAFGNGFKGKPANVDGSQLLDKTDSGRDGYGAFMRGDV